MRRSLWALLCAAVLGACASTDGVPRMLLTVSPAPAASAAPVPAPPGRALVVLRRVELPEYLLSRHVRYREGSNMLVEWPGAVWAERLEIGLTRELAAALRQRLPGLTVCEGACDGATTTLRVEFSALDFRRTPARLQVAGAGQLQRGSAASWIPLSFDLPAATDTPQAHADAIGAALGRVADALAAALRTPG